MQSIWYIYYAYYHLYISKIIVVALKIFIDLATSQFGWAFTPPYYDVLNMKKFFTETRVETAIYIENHKIQANYFFFKSLVRFQEIKITTAIEKRSENKI